MTNEMIVPISAVVARIKTIVSNIEVHKVWIQGEVSNLTKHRSGHYYFSIKDNNAELSCVMFASYASKLNFSLEEGMKVLLKGSLNLYEQRGNLQLYVRSIKQDGMGDLFLEFERRKKMLYDEGYFDELHKTRKPSVISRIGLITAKEGAALHDVLSTIQRRWPMLEVTLFPAYVQGNLAPKSLVSQIKRADTMNFDALLVVRGGGSFEDLFCFNDVELVKTIYNAKTYIVSGVGHEVDTTLCDLVSDHRSVTPTAAAQWVTLDQYEVLNDIKQTRDQLVRSMKHVMNVNQTKFLNLSSNPYLLDPKSWMLEKRLRLDHLITRLEAQKDGFKKHEVKLDEIKKELRNKLSLKISDSNYKIETKKINMNHSMNVYHTNIKKHLKETESLLDAYSPLKVLTRGYSITISDEHVIRSVDDVSKDDVLVTKLSDGMIASYVIKKEKNDAS